MTSMSQIRVEEIAPAKINLALHVTGQRADGYHLLETLVTFASHGDRLQFTPAAHDGFTVSGRFSSFVPQGPDNEGDNLVLKARDLLRAWLSGAQIPAPSVHIHLEKNLPVASGIGGGSADAAACLRGLMRLWQISPPHDIIDAMALGIGADVPMCLVGQPLMARGIGEAIETLSALPAFAVVLANPLVGVSTPQIFRLLQDKTNPPLTLGRPDDRTGWLTAIGGARNDLEAPARGLLPEIADVSGLLAEQGAQLVRMSGSGATCFGIFETGEKAQDAAGRLQIARPDWYFLSTQTIGGGQS